jgi:hypothetical protein
MSTPDGDDVGKDSDVGMAADDATRETARNGLRILNSCSRTICGRGSSTLPVQKGPYTLGFNLVVFFFLYSFSNSWNRFCELISDGVFGRKFKPKLQKGAYFSIIFFEIFFKIFGANVTETIFDEFCHFSAIFHLRSKLLLLHLEVGVEFAVIRIVACKKCFEFQNYQIILAQKIITK